MGLRRVEDRERYVDGAGKWRTDEQLDLWHCHI
jgi:hypothetical protein